MFETLQSVKIEIPKKKTEDLPYFLDRLKNNQNIESKLSKIEQESIELELKKPIFEKLKRIHKDRFTEDFYRNRSRQYLHSYAIQKKNPNEIIEREYQGRKVKTKGLEITGNIKKEEFKLYKPENIISEIESQLNKEKWDVSEDIIVSKMIELYNEIEKVDLTKNNVSVGKLNSLKRKYIDMFCGFYDGYDGIAVSVNDSKFNNNSELKNIKEKIFSGYRDILNDIPTSHLINFLTQKHKEVTQLTGVLTYFTFGQVDGILSSEQADLQKKYFSFIQEQIKNRIVNDDGLVEEEKNKMLADLIEITSGRKSVREKEGLYGKSDKVKTEYINAHEDVRNSEFASKVASDYLFQHNGVIDKILDADKSLTDSEFNTTPQQIYLLFPNAYSSNCSDENGNTFSVGLEDPGKKSYSELNFREKITYSILNKFLLLCGEENINKFNIIRDKINNQIPISEEEEESFKKMDGKFCDAIAAKSTFFEPYLKRLLLIDEERYFKKGVNSNNFPQITDINDKKILDTYLSINGSGREMTDDHAKLASDIAKIGLNIGISIAAAFIPGGQGVGLANAARAINFTRTAATLAKNGKLIQSFTNAGMAGTMSRLLIEKKGHGDLKSAVMDYGTGFVIDGTSGMLGKYIGARFGKILIKGSDVSNLSAIGRNIFVAGADFGAGIFMESFRQNILLGKEFKTLDVFKGPAPWLALFFTLAGMKGNSLTQVEYDNLVLKCKQIEAYATKDPKIGQMEIEIETEFGKKKIKVSEIIKGFPKDGKRMTIIESQTAKSTSGNVDLKGKIDKTSKKMKKEVYKATNKHITEEIRIDEAERQMKELGLIKENLSEKQIVLIVKTHQLTKESMAKIRGIIGIQGSEPPRIKNRKNITETDRQEIEKALNENDPSSGTMPTGGCYDDAIERRTKIFVLENTSEGGFNNKQAGYLVDHSIVGRGARARSGTRRGASAVASGARRGASAVASGAKWIRRMGKKPSINGENPNLTSSTSATTASSITKVNYSNLDNGDINAINKAVSNLLHATIPDIDTSVQAYKNGRISYDYLIQIIKNYEIELNNIDNGIEFIKNGRSQARGSGINATSDQEVIIDIVNSFFTNNGNKFDEIDLVKDKLNKAKNLIEHTKTIDTIKGKIGVKMDNVLYLLGIHKDQKNTLNKIENLIAHNKSFNKRQNILEIYTDLRFLKFLLEKNPSSIGLKADEAGSTLSRVKELITIMEKLKGGKDIYDIEGGVLVKKPMLVKKTIINKEGFMNNYLGERYDAMYIFGTLQDKYTAGGGVAETFGKMLRKEIKSTKRRGDHVNFDEIEKKTEKAMESERGNTNTATSGSSGGRDDLTIDILTTAALPDKYSIPIKLLQSLLKGDKVGTTGNTKKYANLIRNDERLQNKFYIGGGVYDFFSHLIQGRPLHAVYCLAENYLIGNMAFGNTTSARWMRRIAMGADILGMSGTKAVVGYLLSLGGGAIEEFIIEGMPFMISNFTLGINKYFDDKIFENKTYGEYFLEILDKSQNDDQYKVFNAELERIKDNVLSGKKENSEIDIKKLEALKMKIAQKENSAIKKLEILAICDQLNEQFTLKEGGEVYNFGNRIKKYINNNNIDLSTVNSDISYIKQFFGKKLRESEFKSFVRIPPARLIEIIGSSNIQSLADTQIKNKIKGDEDITKSEIIKIMPGIAPYVGSMEKIRIEYKKEEQEKIEQELKSIEHGIGVSSSETTIIKTTNGCPEKTMNELFAKQRKYPDDSFVTSSDGKWILESGSKKPKKNEE